LAKHRADDLFGVRGKPPSFRSVVVLAVAGAVSSALLIASLGTGGRSKTLPQASSTHLAVAATPSESAAYQGVLEPNASPISASPISATPISATPISAPSISAPPPPSTSVSKSAKPSKSASGKPPTVAAGVSLVAHYVVSGESNAGFGATVEIRNAGGAAATWTVEITYGSNVTVASVWNAKMERSANTYRFRANSGSGLGSSQKAQFGYIASAQRGSSKPVRCTVNGRACE
jgi:cellulase/cellobiase CelA1